MSKLSKLREKYRIRKLSDRVYKKIESGLEAKCPRIGCSGKVIKVTGEVFEQYTQDYWEKTNYYRCNRNCKHIWKYLTNAVDYLRKKSK